MRMATRIRGAAGYRSTRVAFFTISCAHRGRVALSKSEWRTAFRRSSSLRRCTTTRTGRHVAVDPFQVSDFNSIGLLNLERAELRQLVDWREARSDLALPEMWRAGERFEFAFIDGCHLLDAVLVDFYYIDKMLPVGGYVVFDDVWMRGVRKVISFALHNRRYELVRMKSPLPVPLWKRAGRIGVRFLQTPLERDWRLRLLPLNIAVLRKTAEDERDWDYHRRF